VIVRATAAAMTSAMCSSSYARAYGRGFGRVNGADAPGNFWHGSSARGRSVLPPPFSRRPSPARGRRLALRALKARNVVACFSVADRRLPPARPRRRGATATTSETGGARAWKVQGLQYVQGRGCSASALPTPDTLFSIGTVAVLPLYGMMIGAPRAAASKRIMSSALPFALMGFLYAMAACLTLQSAGARDLVSTFVTSAGAGVGWSFASIAAHALTLLSGCMATAETASTAWLHLLSLDLFVARHVYLDSLEADVPASHSLVFCCMFGPVGFLSHVLTKGVWARRGGREARS